MMGPGNPKWKGDQVGYSGLHDWIRARKPKPDLCEDCKKKPPRDLANLSGEYLRDVNDYRWLCGKCHIIFDGRDRIWGGPNFRGHRHSLKSRERIAEAMTGRIFNDKSIQKMRDVAKLRKKDKYGRFISNKHG